MKKNSKFSIFLLILIFLAGLSLLLYPSISNYWNSLHQSRAISAYTEQVADLNDEEYDRIWKEAVEYNAHIEERDNCFSLTDSQRDYYESLLNISDSGIMGYIEIPTIDVYLPIYHGTDDTVLSVAAGHLDWTSLPTGGLGTHCVLSAHRGLPSAKLFTNLDQVVEGDTFMLRVLDEVLTYEVDQILIVEPTHTEALGIVDGEDYCTLVTCTPYGINTHRLLVRGHRIENAQQAAAVHITAEAIQIEPLLIASVLGVPTLMLLMILVFLSGNKKGKGSKRGGKNE